jgi:hypothetical protein
MAVFEDLHRRNIYADPERVIEAILAPRSRKTMERYRARQQDAEDDDSDLYARTLHYEDGPAVHYDHRSGDIEDDDEKPKPRIPRLRLHRGGKRS